MSAQDLGVGRRLTSDDFAKAPLLLQWLGMSPFAKRLRLIGVALCSTAALACSGGAKPGRPAAHPCGELPDLTRAVAELEAVRPSWKQVRAWAAQIGPLSLPADRKGLNVLPGRFGDRGYAITQHTDYWAEIAAAHPVNMSPAANAGPIAPPHVGSSGTVLKYPYTGADLDEKLRAQCAILLCERARGRPVVFALQDQSENFPRFADHAGFRSWVAERHLPLAAEMARAAEAMQAEFLDPFPNEVEIFLNRFHQPLLDTGTADLVAAANAWSASLRETIRPAGGAPLYSGRLVGRSAANFETGGYQDGRGGSTSDGSFWKGVRYAGYDEVHVSLTSNCSPTYLDAQLAGFQAVAAGLPWYIAEVWLYDRGWGACGGAAANPAEAYLAQLFSKIDALGGDKPRGIAIDVNPGDDAGTLSPAALELISERFRSR